MNNEKIENETQVTEDTLELEVQELEDRFQPDVHGGCVCSTTCDCTSCSCVVVF
jgi:hypothetical protein